MGGGDDTVRDGTVLDATGRDERGAVATGPDERGGGGSARVGISR